MNLPLPTLSALLLRPRREALAAFAAAGWRPWAHPIGLDAERRRALNVDLSEPEVALSEGGAVRAVAHVETDREGLVTLVEVVSAEPAEPARVAAALLPGEPGQPRTGGGAAAREWIWGPESGSTAAVEGEPVRLWICAEQAYGDRLWLVATVVRRASGDDD
ncbi:MAG TPA: hypothetical protein VFP50_17265 [Anaeromyxobacteraceae bacterium]|nr:hypothetical protein [Anaeromyxobacteraceae bacterium]